MSPADIEEDLPWERAKGKRLSNLLSVEAGPGPQDRCTWLLCILEASSRDIQAAAWLVAEELMRQRFAKASHLFDAWREAAVNDSRLSENLLERILPFIRTAFGTREDPLDDGLLGGLVAEYTWYILAKELVVEGRVLRHIEPPSFYVTSPGGDGLVTYELADGTLIFRLWEIKKHVGSGHLSGTISKAYSQLGKRGSNYLAQYVALAPTEDPPVAQLYSEMVDKWVDGAAEAGAGVAVGTSRPGAPRRRCFSTMHEHFPSLDRQGQLEGLIAAIGDYSEFAKSVREFVWNVL